ncbi:MAG: CDP-glycerol glycerophosphotransferase family protein [Bacteroidales bacterium]|nr:CDP-glycerol glycerophosphotransferase family protein [Bacteroidales bacterium]
MKLSQVKFFLRGLLVAPMRPFVRIKPDLWIFGSEYGRRYSQNARYLFEYVIKNHPEIRAVWITNAKEVHQDLKAKGLPVLMNNSFRGIKACLSARLIVSTTWLNDIRYTFRKKGQEHLHLMHGMPLKVGYYDTPAPKKSLFIKFTDFLTDNFVGNYRLEDAVFLPVTSEFFKGIIKQSTRNERVEVTGQPRTDDFLRFDAQALRQKYGFAPDDVIITYMPTHRSYGKGALSPYIFKDNEQVINFFKENKIVLVWKQHINMTHHYASFEHESCFRDYSANPQVDSQELLFISDVLISDYSSCVYDFMMLGRPILFHDYDDYTHTDNPIYITKEDMAQVGPISENESQLFENIRQALVQTMPMYIENKEVLSRYHQYIDDHSCQRVYEAVTKALAEQHE